MSIPFKYARLPLLPLFAMVKYLCSLKLPVHYFLCPQEIRVDKPRMVELVEGLGIYVPAHKLLSAVRASKNSSSALLRQLMGVIFTDEELRTSSVRGRGTRPALDPQKMEAIMGELIIPYSEKDRH